VAGDNPRWSPLELLGYTWLLNVGDRNVDRLGGHIMNISPRGAHAAFTKSSGIRAS